MKKQSIFSIYNNERGISVIWVALMMFIFLCLGAFALDFSHIFVAKNELQNAADAGALAGARFLYNDDGTLINEGANQIAFNAAVANLSEKVPVEMLAHGVVYANVGDVYPVQQVEDDETVLDVVRGHWSFGLGELPKGFTANASLNPVDLWGVSDAELDENTDFINAVQVTTRRTTLSGGTPIASFFARIMGYENFQQTATAIAYIGFAGTLRPGDANAPIAICDQTIRYDDEYNCNIGRMLNSGSNTDTSNTGGWTNFSQPCETANVPSLRPLICGTGNPDPVTLHGDVGAVNGVQDTIFQDLETCWKDITDSKTTWELTLPVIDCPGNSVENCATLTGAVTLKVLWVQRDNPGYDQAPREMYDHETEEKLWPTEDDLDMPVQALEEIFVGGGPSDTFPTFPEDTKVGDVFDGDTEDSGRVRWASFVKKFNLQNVGPPGEAPYATFAFKSIYFLPDCTPHELRGLTGGHNYGVLARIPVLVK